jgi:hypothetical protein
MYGKILSIYVSAMADKASDTARLFQARLYRQSVSPLQFWQMMVDKMSHKAMHSHLLKAIIFHMHNRPRLMVNSIETLT